MDPKLEIRKLQPSSLRELSQILEYSDSWKELMAIIPKKLDANQYDCNISCDNPPKYNSEHVRLIENASLKMRKGCTDILFDEWGTSGKVRPALGHLLHLLVKAQLFRAADYVAMKLLQIQPPIRPAIGPAAPINTSISQHNFSNDIEVFLNNVNYPSSLILDKNSDNLYITSKANNIPQIIITSTREKKRKTGHVHFEYETNFNENLIQFSETQTDNSEENECNIPALTSLLIENDNNSKLSQEVQNTNDDLKQSDTQTDNVPVLSTLNLDSKEVETNGNIPQISNLLQSETKISIAKQENNVEFENSDIIPKISALNLSSSELSASNNSKSSSLSSDDRSNSIQTFPNSESLPPLSSLLCGNSKDVSEEKKVNNEILSNSYKSSDLSRKHCTSPLPNLSLNTKLPHYTYQQLEEVTNSFDETPHQISCCSDNNLLESSTGRFLGSGAFGSVFLGVKLLDRPVAIKKLFLDNVDVVNIDDPITKQFKNEVEVLSKYQHENLLSLVGYSCDGPTYCILYEYIPGGALKERLQNTGDNTLFWKDRVNIALGTAKGISYLHSAYSTPLIHRDIKTANILLDFDNRPKLCDFGIIKLVPNQNTNTSTTVFGTSAYMAPEAFRGDISIKLDTFSFGVVLLELLTSLPPLDNQREGYDIVTHVEGTCEDDIITLLDKKAGPWIIEDTNFAQEIFKISNKCLSEKKTRPTMVQVTAELSELVSFII